MQKKRSFFDWIEENTAIIFLISGLILVAMLTQQKVSEQDKIERLLAEWQAETMMEETKEHASIPLEISSFEQNGATIYMSTQPISTGLFHQFVKETGHRTWRERYGIWPTWEREREEAAFSWEKDANAPVLWLTPSDAKAFCTWLTKNHHKEYRLPKVRELESLSKNLVFWEWTSESWADHGGKQGNASQYLTAWKMDSPLKHRREEDLGDPELPAATFRVVQVDRE
ncbi:MAG: hypothetical protein CMO81_09455 [Waddliaceae bacterium]|nr:hypothetical protein [Waddliaceae bacterium]